MLTKTEFEKDLENLRKLQEDGKIDEGVNIEHVADQLPSWRESDYWKDKAFLARYGRGSDLEKLAVDPDWNTRAAVAKRGRPKDLDVLVRDPDADVRRAVVSVGRDKDLAVLINDKGRCKLKSSSMSCGKALLL